MTWRQRLAYLAIFLAGWFVGFFMALREPGPDDYDDRGRLRGHG